MGIYDIERDWGANVSEGPFFKDPLPMLPARVPDRFHFLEFPLNSPFGLPAFPLTATSRFVDLASKLGYDLLTYKSVRSIPWGGNAFPHWKYADIDEGIDLLKNTKTIMALENKPEGQDASMVNSFGVHSASPEVWQEDFDKAQWTLLPGQLLILSVMPSRIEGRTLIEDGKELAKLVGETSAKVVEVNFACPNTDGGKGLIYEDTKLTSDIVTAMKEVLGDTPLLAKVGYYQNQEDLKLFLRRTKGALSGLSTMNTYSGVVVMPDGKEAFPGRPTAGISGAGIRTMAFKQAANTVRIREELLLVNFGIIGIGGVTRVEHIREYLDLGVDAVQSAVGAYENPLLAYQFLQTL
jgi:dihydroorotate dehydrogenase